MSIQPLEKEHTYQQLEQDPPDPVPVKYLTVNCMLEIVLDWVHEIWLLRLYQHIAKPQAQTLNCEGCSHGCNTYSCNWEISGCLNFTATL